MAQSGGARDIFLKQGSLCFAAFLPPSCYLLGKQGDFEPCHFRFLANKLQGVSPFFVSILTSLQTGLFTFTSYKSRKLT